MRFLTNERRYLLLQKDPLQPVNVVALLELESPHVFYIHICMCVYIHTHTHTLEQGQKNGADMSGGVVDS